MYELYVHRYYSVTLTLSLSLSLLLLREAALTWYFDIVAVTSAIRASAAPLARWPHCMAEGPSKVFLMRDKHLHRLV